MNGAPESEVADRYSAIARGFTAQVEAAGADGWPSPTPCPDWTTRDIVEHVIGVHQRVGAYLSDADTDAETRTPGPDDDIVCHVG